MRTNSYALLFDGHVALDTMADPEPPFDCGSPERAERALVEGVRARRRAVQERRTEVVERARTWLGLERLGAASLSTELVP